MYLTPCTPGLTIEPDSVVYAVSGVPLTLTCNYNSAHASSIDVQWDKGTWIFSVFPFYSHQKFVLSAWLIICKSC